MGNYNSAPVIAPGAVQIILDQGACTECTRRSVPYQPPPPWIPANQVVWDGFMRDLQAQVSRMWTEGWFIFLGLASMLVIVGLSALDVGRNKLLDVDFGVSFIGIAGILAGIGAMMAAKSKNQAIDIDIDRVCQQYSPQLGVGIAYVRQWTGVCKPKHARIFRAIIVAPPGQPPVLGVTGGGGMGAMQIGGGLPTMQVMNPQVAAPPPYQQVQVQPQQPLREQSDIPVAVAVPTAQPVPK